jgi:hypothetical protein
VLSSKTKLFDSIKCDKKLIINVLQTVACRLYSVALLITFLWLSTQVFVILIFSSCSINGSFQGLYSYYNKTNKIAPQLIQAPKYPICNLIQPDTPIIYIVNGIQLKGCVEQFKKSLVYIWRPKCSSRICIPLERIQLFCQKNNIELFIVAEYYDFEKMTLKHSISRPIFGIDCNYYSSHLTKKYLDDFKTELLGKEIISNEKYFFLFISGCLVEMTEDIEKLKI